MVLFESGVLVLLVFYIGSMLFEFNNVLVGWDGSLMVMWVIYVVILVLEKVDKIMILVIEKNMLVVNG